MPDMECKGLTMPRRRMIDPAIWQSEDFSKLSTLAKLVFIGLFSIADDEGRGKAQPVFIKSNLFPYDEKMRVADIETSLSEIGKHMSTVFYSHNGNNYYALSSWMKFQRVDHPTPSKIPEPSNIQEVFENDSRNVQESLSPSIKEFSLGEKNTCANAFDVFWKAYPKKRSKNDALKAFKALKPDAELLKKYSLP